MKALKIILGLVAVALLVLVVRLPIATTPGFFIGGTASAAPANWFDTSAVLETKLRVPGAIPRVVIIWFVEIDNDFYIVGETESGWVSMLGNGGLVQMRIGDLTYSLQAGMVNSGGNEIIQAWQAKYESDYPDFFTTTAAEEFLDDSSIYRLSRM